MKLVIKGRPSSKKNSKIPVYRNGRTYIFSSKQHHAFETDALKQLLPQRKKTFTGYVRVDYVFHQKGRLRMDADNAQGTINDLLQKGLVIENDSNILEGSFKVVLNAPEWLTEVTIEALGEKI